MPPGSNGPRLRHMRNRQQMPLVTEPDGHLHFGGWAAGCLRIGGISPLAKPGISRTAWKACVRLRIRVSPVPRTPYPAQLAFELTAAIQLANYYFVLVRDPDVLERARAVLIAARYRTPAAASTVE